MSSMQEPTTPGIRYVQADDTWQVILGEQWKDWYPGLRLYLDNGFSLLAVDGEEVVGVLAVKWLKLHEPLSDCVEGWIGHIAVRESHCRRGIARRLIAEGIERAAEHGACQLRTHTTYDNVAAIQMWKALGFGLSPARMMLDDGTVMEGYFVVKRILSCSA